MKVSLNEIKKIFDSLMQEKISREEVAFWASKRQMADDIDDLKYDPPYEEKRIWRAITYLMGVDLKDVDGSYLHSIENFFEFRKEVNL
ncbi:MAG: hypothetical protein KAR79_02205 [Simkaniaceae bacterium]|nr:hypothetical protein [Simkaniaceae bacterium]